MVETEKIIATLNQYSYTEVIYMGEDQKGANYIPGLGVDFYIDPEETNFQLPAQADSEATTIAELTADFNALLQKLRDANLMK